jgi:transposase InsO family protein
MPWQEYDRMELRTEFVRLATQDAIPMTELCRRFGISRKTGYKWLERYRAAGSDGLADRSRRPARSPARTSVEVEAAVLALRDAHPAWGGRKLHHRLVALGVTDAPSPSTITAILHRHGRIAPAASAMRQPPIRFEHAEPNALWQLDFLGHQPLATGRVHPLCVIDDHSRYALGLVACANEQRPTVQTHLERLFRQYGLPGAILADNSPPWGVTTHPGHLTTLGAWLVRLGIEIWHGRPYHPQTQGKVERFHQTVTAEVLAPYRYPDLAACQHAFDRWRPIYNHARPHEALGDQTPGARYRPSVRPFPPTLPPIAYGPGDVVCRVYDKGQIRYSNRLYYVSEALAGQPVAVRPTLTDGVVEVYFCQQQVTTLDLRQDTDGLID